MDTITPPPDATLPALPPCHWFMTFAQFRSACSPRTFEDQLRVVDAWHAHKRQLRHDLRPPRPPRVSRQPRADAVVAERMLAAARTPTPPLPAPRVLVQRVAAPPPRLVKPPAKPQPPSEPPQNAAGFIPTYDLGGARTRGEAFADTMPVNPGFHRPKDPDPAPPPRVVTRS